MSILFYTFDLSSLYKPSEIIVRLCSWGVDPHKWDQSLMKMTAEQYSLRV